MAALDFPPSPVVGDKYPVTPVPGQPQYTWDGEKWTTTGAQVTSASPSNNLPLMDATPAVPGVGTQYSREDHVHPTDTSRAADTVVLKKSPQSLTTTEQTDVRKNVYAAPFDALGWSGMQVNGSMEVSQENGASNVSITAGTTKYVVDGFSISLVGATTRQINAQQAASGIPGIPKHIQTGCAIPAALGAVDAQYIVTSIEGYRWARLGWGTATAQSITISFWAYSSLVGTISVSVRNSTGARSYVVDVPLVVGQQYKTVTIPGDTAGTWAADNTVGAYISFCLGAGTNWHTSPNTWVGANAVGTSATTNYCAAVNNAFTITGVVILPGIEAPSAARSPLIMRPYDQELATCKRYYQKTSNGSGAAYATNAVQLYFAFNEMRAAPTLSCAAPFTIVEPTVGTKTQSALSIATIENNSSFAFANLINYTGLVVSRSYWAYTYTPLILDARL